MSVRPEPDVVDEGTARPQSGDRVFGVEGCIAEAKRDALTPREGPSTPLASLLDDLEAKAKAATKGPWKHGYDDGSGAVGYFDEGGTIVGPEENVITGGRDDYGVPHGVLRESDAEYIAAFDPDTCLALIEVARAAQEAVDEAEYQEQSLMFTSYIRRTLVPKMRVALARLGTERRPQ